MVSPPKLTAHEYGLIGSRRRWGEHGRILRLDQLDDVTRNIICAILDAQKNKAAADLANAPATPDTGQG
jgi:hypothetical protein